MSELLLVLKARDEATAVLQSFNSTFTTTVGTVEQYSVATNAATKASGAMSKQVGLLGNNAKRLATALAGGSAVYLAARAMREATRAAIGFDKALHDVWTLTDATWESMVAIGQQVRNLAYDFPESAEVATNALYEIYSATFYGADAMGILEQSLVGATAGLSDTRTAADMLTTVLNAYRMSAEEATHINDLLFTTVKYGKTRFHELAMQFGRLSGVSAPAGVALEEMTAAIATLTRQGIATDWAVTSLRQSIMQVLRPGKLLENAIAKIGYSSGRAMFEALGFAGSIEAINAWAERTGTGLEQLFSNVRAVTAVLPLAGTAADEYKKDIARMAESAGAAQTAFEKQAEALAYQLGVLRERFRDAAIDIGEIFVPAIQGALGPVQLIVDSIKFVSNVLGNFGKELVKVGGFVAALTAIVYGLIAAVKLLKIHVQSLMLALKASVILAVASAFATLVAKATEATRAMLDARREYEAWGELLDRGGTVSIGFDEKQLQFVNDMVASLSQLEGRESMLAQLQGYLKGPFKIKLEEQLIGPDLEKERQMFIQAIAEKLPTAIGSAMLEFYGLIEKAATDITRHVKSTVQLTALQNALKSITNQFWSQYEILSDETSTIEEIQQAWKDINDQFKSLQELEDIAGVVGSPLVEEIRMRIEAFANILNIELKDAVDTLGESNIAGVVEAANKQFNQYMLVIEKGDGTVADIEEAWKGMGDTVNRLRDIYAAVASVDPNLAESIKTALIEMADIADIELKEFEGVISRHTDILRSTLESMRSALVDATRNLISSLFKVDKDMSEVASSGNIPRGFKLLRAAWGVAEAGQPWSKPGEAEGTSLYEDILAIISSAFADLIWEELIPQVEWDDFIKEVSWDGFLGWLQGLWADYLMPILSPIVSFAQTLLLGTATLTGFAAAVTVALGVLLSLGVAIGVVVGLFAIVKGAIEGLREDIKAFLDPIISAVKWSWEQLQPLVEAVKHLFASVAPIFSVFGEVISYGIKLVTPLFAMLAPILELLGGVLNIVAKGIKLLWDNVLEPILKTLTIAFGLVANVMIAFYNAIRFVIALLTLGIVNLPKVDPIELPKLQTTATTSWIVDKTGMAVVHEGEEVSRGGSKGDVYNYNVTLPNVTNADEFDREMQRITRMKNLRENGVRQGSYGVT